MMDMNQINTYSSLTGVPVTSAQDLPSLIEALEAFGQFASASAVRDWHKKIEESADAEFTAEAETAEA